MKTITVSKESTLLANNIRSIRKLNNLTQEDFGNLFNLRRAVVGSYEEGRANPSIETLIQISDYYKASIDDLIKTKIISNDQLYGAAKKEVSFSIKDGIHEVKKLTEGLQRAISKTLDAPTEIDIILTVKCNSTVL